MFKSDAVASSVYVCRVGEASSPQLHPSPAKYQSEWDTGQSEWRTCRTLYGSILGSCYSRYGKATFDSLSMWNDGARVEQEIISRGMMMWCLESQLEPQDTRVSSRCSSLHTWRWVNSVCRGHVCHQDGAVLASRLIRLEEKITSWRRFTLEVPSAHRVYNNTPLK